MRVFIKKYLIVIFKILSIIIPKDENLWLFGAWGGNLYSDNSKKMFEYINAMYKEKKCVWISSNKEVVNKVIDEGYLAYEEKSIKGLWNIVRGKIAFCTEYKSDVSMLLNKKTKIIQLWHGMGIKAVGLESGWVKEQTAKERKEYLKQCKDNYAKWYWMCASQEAKQKYMRSFAVPESNFYITGQPKDDAFVNVKNSPYVEAIRQKHLNTRIAVYLPTHRNFGKENAFTDETSIETLEKVNEMLKEKNIVMIFKPHFHEFEKYQGYNTDFSNIIFATDKNKFGDVYEFLPCCDMLITDYSGIMFGYLASGKPIIYFPYDYEKYVEGDAGFCYDYEDILYGPVCKTWREVVETASTIKSEDYAEERERQRKRFCPFNDGKNSERVYRQVVEIL